jgi:hypothetical protein
VQRTTAERVLAALNRGQRNGTDSRSPLDVDQAQATQQTPGT